MRLDFKAPLDRKIKADVEKNEMLKHLLTMTPAQIDAWVDNNVTTLSDVKSLLKRILKVISLVLHKEFKQ